MKSLFILFAALFALTVCAEAQVPQIINYQGRIVDGSTNFNGSGQFKFALVNTNGSVSYWSNDGTSSAGSQPTSGIALNVANGLYSVLLGDSTIANMSAIPATVFGNTDVRLRVWFNDGTNGFQLLSPDQRIAAVGYALVASTAQNLSAGVAQANLSGGSGALDLSHYTLSFSLGGSILATNSSGQLTAPTTAQVTSLLAGGVGSIGSSSGMNPSTNGNLVVNLSGDTAGYTAPNSDTELTVVNWDGSNTNSGAEIGCAVMTVQSWYQTATWSASSNTLTLTGTGAGTSASISGPMVGQGAASNGIWDGTTVAAVSGSTVTLAPPNGQTNSTFAANSGTRDVVCFFDRNTTGSGSWAGSTATTITLASANPAVAVGDYVTGTNIPAGDTVATVVSSTNFTLTTATTGTGSGTTLTFTPPAFYATNGGGPTPPGGSPVTYNGEVGSQFATVPVNRPSGLIPGTAQFVFNANAYDLKSFEISSPGASGLDPGNYSFAMFDFQNKLFRIPYWVQYAYQPSDPGWQDAFTVSPVTGITTAYNQFDVSGGTPFAWNTPQIDVETQYPILRIHNTFDTLAGFLTDNNSSLQLGMYNGTGSTSGAVSANSYQSMFGMNSSGEVGSLTNSRTNFSASPLFRNLLDDGNGNMSVSGNLTVAGSTSYKGLSPGIMMIAGTSGLVTSTTSPNLGAANVNTINGLTVSSSTGTLTVANGKTLTSSNTLSFSGTDGSTLAIGMGGTLANGAFENFSASALLAGTSATNGPGGLLAEDSSGNVYEITGLPRMGVDSSGSVLTGQKGSYVGQWGFSKDGYAAIWNGTNWNENAVLGMPTVFFLGNIGQNTGNVTNGLQATNFLVTGGTYQDNCVEIINETGGYSTLVFGYNGDSVLPATGSGRVAFGITGLGAAPAGQLTHCLFTELGPDIPTPTTTVTNSTPPMGYRITQWGMAASYSGDHDRFLMDQNQGMTWYGWNSAGPTGNVAEYISPAGIVVVGGSTVSGSAALQTPSLSVGGQTSTTGNVVIDSAGTGLQVKEGSGNNNAKQGVATLSGGTATVSNTTVTSNSRIFLTTQSPSGTVGTPYVSARTAGISFTITSTSASDASTVAWEIFEPAP